MEDFRQKQKMRRALYSKTTLVVLAGVFLFLLLKTWGIYEKERMSHESLEDARREQEELSVRADALAAEVARLETDAGFEEVLRDRYGVAKKGEEVIVLIDKDSDTMPLEESSQGWWQKIKSWFAD